MTNMTEVYTVEEFCKLTGLPVPVKEDYTLKVHPIRSIKHFLKVRKESRERAASFIE